MIYDYLHYREYLKDFYIQKKQNNPWFSYRYMARVVQMDPSHLVKIIMGKRHIARTSIPHFIKLCELDGKEADFFEALVKFNKAKTEKESKKYYDEMTSLIDVKQYQLLKSQHEFYSTWYHSAIFNLLHCFEFYGDYDKLAAMLSPPVAPGEAQRSVELLKELGLIKANESGRFVLTNNFITCGESRQSKLIRTFQKETILLASESLERHPKEIRNISSVTITVDRNDLNKLDQLIGSFRSELFKMVEKTDKPDSVYQLNIQLFPLALIDEHKPGAQS